MNESILAATILRPGLLEGATILLAAAPGPSPRALAPAVEQAGIALGASVASFVPDPADDEATAAALRAAVAQDAEPDMLVVDGAGLFAFALAEEGDGLPPLRHCVDCAWSATRAAAAGSWLPAGRGGRIVHLSPAPDAGAHAEPARAALENLVRTLSVEWARHGVTAVALAPGVTTSPAEAAAVVALLASPAGAYYSGCQLDLRGPEAR